MQLKDSCSQYARQKKNFNYLHITLVYTYYYKNTSLKAVLTLSFDAEVFTLITGSPLDLSITTVLSVPRLARKQKYAQGINNTQDIKNSCNSLKQL